MPHGSVEHYGKSVYAEQAGLAAFSSVAHSSLHRGSTKQNKHVATYWLHVLTRLHVSMHEMWK